jgi:hypothetical protein
MIQKHPHPDGTRYPADHVVAVLASREQAQDAAAALQASGFDAEDIVLFHGREDHDTITHHETFLSHLSRLLEPVTADAGRRYYLDALAEGKSVLLVYAPDQDTVDRACRTLEQHGAHNPRAFRRWYVEDLPEHQPLNR